MDSW